MNKKKYNRFLALALSALLLPVASISVFAEESPLADYSFEELLAMSDEEICSISEEVAYAYQYGVAQWAYSQACYTLCFDDLTLYRDAQTSELDTEALIAAIDLPAEIVNVDASTYEVTYVNNVKYDSVSAVVQLDAYPEYSELKVYRTASAVLFNNPNIAECMLDPVAGAEDGILGDVNADGVVDASDASLILGFAALVGCGTPADPADYGIDPDIADINEDGELDARDSSQILIISAEEGVA